MRRKLTEMGGLPLVVQWFRVQSLVWELKIPGAYGWGGGTQLRPRAATTEPTYPGTQAPQLERSLRIARKTRTAKTCKQKLGNVPWAQQGRGKEPNETSICKCSHKSPQSSSPSQNAANLNYLFLPHHQQLEDFQFILFSQLKDQANISSNKDF